MRQSLMDIYYPAMKIYPRMKVMKLFIIKTLEEVLSNQEAAS